LSKCMFLFKYSFAFKTFKKIIFWSAN
jgi:hypothetical protein